MYLEALQIIFISITSAFVAEALSWVLVYRTSHYKSLLASVDKQNKKLDKERDSPSDVSKQIKQGKKFDRAQTQLEKSTQDLNAIKTKSMFAVGLIFVLLVTFLGNLYGGKVVAKLPFVPLGLIQGMTHRNLEGEDYTDCSYLFIYILSSMAFRSTIQKWLGFAPPRGLPQVGAFGTAK
eukprot:Sdes_comp20888_c0_seq3m17994